MSQRLPIRQIDPDLLADGTYSVQITGGVVSLVANPPQYILTSEINGVPDLVWSTDNQLILTEAP